MIDQLKAYVVANNLPDKALEYFWIAFNNWKHDHPESYLKISHIPIEALSIFVHSIGLRSSQWPECDFNHVTVTILIHYGEQQLGNYVAWFSLSEDVDDDDFLEIY